MTLTSLSPKHLLLTLIVVISWGVNFVAVSIGLKDLPPFLFCALRFLFSAIPLVFFLPKPRAPFKYIAAFGVVNFALQFGLVFSGMHLGLSPGLASLVMQMQVFFSMGLAFLFFKEIPGYLKILGSLISFSGIATVALHLGGDVTLIGLSLTLLAALAWSFGNIITKKINADSPLSLVVWGNLAALPFMTVASFLMDGPEKISQSLQNISWAGIGALAYVVYVSSHIGYGLWGTLLKKYPTSVVAPFTFLIPVVGFLSSIIFLGEEFSQWKITASLLILLGLVFNLFEKQILGILGKLKRDI